MQLITIKYFNWLAALVVDILFAYSSLPQAVESVQFLCKVQGLDSAMELYRQHMAQLLDWLSASVNTWSSYSPQRLQLHIIVIQSGEKWSLNVHKTLPKLYCRCWSLHVWRHNNGQRCTVRFWETGPSNYLLMTGKSPHLSSVWTCSLGPFHISTLVWLYNLDHVLLNITSWCGLWSHSFLLDMFTHTRYIIFEASSCSSCSHVIRHRGRTSKPAAVKAAARILPHTKDPDSFLKLFAMVLYV